MLVRLDPALLHVPDRQELLDFLRRPFTEESCRRVDEDLPEISSVYRALASARATWEATTLPSLTGDPTTAFMPIDRIGTKDLPPMPPFLLQAQAELLYEDLRDHQERLIIRSGDNVTEQGTLAQTALALRAFSLHEAAFMTLAGFFCIRRSRSLVEFSLTSLGEDCLRNRVRTTAMQGFTDGAMRATFQEVMRDARAHGSLQPERIADVLNSRQLDMLEVRLLDVYFSLSSRMQCDPLVASLLTRARKLCRWMAILEMVRLAGEHALSPDTKMLARLKLDPALPGSVATMNVKALTSDKGILQAASGGWTLGEASLGHAIGCCKSAVLNDAATRTLGERFEVHVKSYVEQCVSAEDYVFRNGFKASGKGKGRNYDCDLILFEIDRQKIFFVQTKWKRDSRTANLDDELNEWRAKNSPLTHGVTQLQGLRERLSEKRVLDQVKGQLNGLKLTDRQIMENSHFIVVHTLPYFNAYLNDGIAIYEWNFFRNVLLRGATRRAPVPISSRERLNHAEIVSHHEVLPLEQPERAIDHFYQAVGADLTVIPHAMDARIRAKYGFDLKSQERPWWKSLTRRKVLRVARPYL